MRSPDDPRWLGRPSRRRWPAASERASGQPRRGPGAQAAPGDAGWFDPSEVAVGVGEMLDGVGQADRGPPGAPPARCVRVGRRVRTVRWPSIFATPKQQFRRPSTGAGQMATLAVRDRGVGKSSMVSVEGATARGGGRQQARRRRRHAIVHGSSRRRARGPTQCASIRRSARSRGTCPSARSQGGSVRRGPPSRRRVSVPIIASGRGFA